jgi:hypothetical protein
VGAVCRPCHLAGAAGADAAGGILTVHLLWSLLIAVLGASAAIRAIDRPLD